jgi:hypothetical protein
MTTQRCQRKTVPAVTSRRWRKVVGIKLDQHGEYGAVFPDLARPWVGSTSYGDLVAQRGQLDVLRRRRSIDHLDAHRRDGGGPAGLTRQLTPA